MKTYCALVMCLAFLVGTVDAQCFADPNYKGDVYLMPEGSVYDEEKETWFLPEAWTMAYYKAKFLFLVPSDTTLEGLPVTIEKVIIDSITGLPDDFQVRCSPNNCEFEADVPGCFTFEGTPTSDEVGTRRIFMYATFYIKLGEIPLKDSQFFEFARLKTVHNPDPTGLGEPGISDLSIHPNPAMDRFSISYWSQKQGTADIRVIDYSGRIMYDTKSPALPGENSLTISPSLPKGFYRILIELDGDISGKSLVIQ